MSDTLRAAQRDNDAAIGRAVPRPLWRNRDYMLLWSGQMVSTLGSGVSGISFPLLVLAITGSYTQAGASRISGAAMLLIALIGVSARSIRAFGIAAAINREEEEVARRARAGCVDLLWLPCAAKHLTLLSVGVPRTPEDRGVLEGV